MRFKVYNVNDKKQIRVETTKNTSNVEVYVKNENGSFVLTKNLLNLNQSEVKKVLSELLH